MVGSTTLRLFQTAESADVPMNECICITQFVKELGSDPKAAARAGQFLAGIMVTCLPRLMSNAVALRPGSEAINCMRPQRFLQRQELEIALRLLFNE